MVVGGKQAGLKRCESTGSPGRNRCVRRQRNSENIVSDEYPELSPGGWVMQLAVAMHSCPCPCFQLSPTPSGINVRDALLRGLNATSHMGVTL